MTMYDSIRKPCAYSFYIEDPDSGKRTSVGITKAADRITVILKGSTRQKTQQNQVITQRFRPDAIRQLNENLFSIRLTKAPFHLMEGTLQFLRQKGIIAHHAYRPLKSEHTCYFLTDQIIIRFQQSASTQQIKKLFQQYHLKPQGNLVVGAKIYVVELGDRSGADKDGDRGKNPAKVAALLQREAIVISADVNLVNRLLPLKTNEAGHVTINENKKPSRTPSTASINDPLFNQQWSLHAKATRKQGKPWILDNADVNAEQAWQLAGHGRPDICIAVIDMAIDYQHPDLKDQLVDDISLIKKEFIFNEGSADIPDELLRYASTHGTECAGIAVASKNTAGVIGIASGCRLLPVWLSANASEATLIKCFTAVAQKADVISFSLAPYPGKMILNNLRKVLTQISQTGGPRGKGCVICVCAGNFNLPIRGKLQSKTIYFSHEGVLQQLNKGEEIYNLFAAHEGVITVAASTSLNKAAAYNNYGKELSVCAPSADWEPAKGMHQLTSAGIITTSSNGSPAEGLYTDRFCGTSAAAPLVAGIAALMLSANKELTAAAVKEILQNTADKINPGEAAYNAQGHSLRYGYGKVNAGRAVQEAIDRKKRMN